MATNLQHFFGDVYAAGVVSGMLAVSIVEILIGFKTVNLYLYSTHCQPEIWLLAWFYKTLYCISLYVSSLSSTAVNGVIQGSWVRSPAPASLTLLGNVIIYSLFPVVERVQNITLLFCVSVYSSASTWAMRPCIVQLPCQNNVIPLSHTLFSSMRSYRKFRNFKVLVDAAEKRGRTKQTS